MASKKITELVQATNVADSDLFVIETTNGTRSVPYSNFKPAETNSGGADCNHNGAGNNSTAIGYNASANEENSIAIGTNANVNINGINSIAIGKGAVVSNNDSIAIGGSSNAMSYQSTVLGASAYAYSTSVAIGYGANAYSSSVVIGLNAKACDSSVAIGYNAVVNSMCGIAIGSGAKAKEISIGKGVNSNGQSIAIGSNAPGSQSVIIGSAIESNSALNDVVAIGAYVNIGTNSNCVAIGSYSNVNGNYSIAIGSSVSANYSIAIGKRARTTGDYSTAIGYNAVTSNANSIQLGDSRSLSSITAKVSITTTSDERDKTDITAINDGALDFLNKIKAIRYVFNGRKLYIDEENLSEEERKKLDTYGMCAYDKEAHAKGTKKGNRIRVGVSAQNIQEALKDVFGDSGYANLVNDNLFDYNPDEIPEGVESQLAVNYEGFIPFLIKAVQELDARVKELESKQ